MSDNITFFLILFNLSASLSMLKTNSLLSNHVKFILALSVIVIDIDLISSTYFSDYIFFFKNDNFFDEILNLESAKMR